MEDDVVDGSYKSEKEKTRMSPVLWDWNWRYKCEFIVNNLKM